MSYSTAEAVIVSAVRTPIATSTKGTLRDTRAEDLAAHIVAAALTRSGLDPSAVDDVILAESHYGGRDLARYAAVAAGLTHVPGQAVNRHCAASLTAVGSAAAAIRSGMERAVIAGGVHSFSMAPQQVWRVPGTDDTRIGLGPTFPYRDGATTDNVAISVGWNTCLELGLTREELDRWALRSHQRAISAIDSGVFVDEMAPFPVSHPDGSVSDFAVDEHPRRDSTLEKLASLKPLHPEIDGFSITAGNSSGRNDAAAALVITSSELAESEGLRPLARIVAWGAIGVDPERTGMGGVEVIPRVLERAGLSVGDIALWEINEAFAPVPIAACRVLGIAEDVVNIFGSGCSLGHPIAASGARMLTTLAHELHRRGEGRAVASMCAAAGHGGAVVIEAM